MYRLVIIEDENLIRKGLVFTIDWISMNCQIVGEAENGEEGLKIIKRLKPDIVILDVNMPKLNGIEMLKKLGEIDFESIILSGYDDFEYAKSAIDLDICAYLLKPLVEEDLRKAIEKAKSRLLKHQKNLNIEKEFSDALSRLDIEGIDLKDRYSETTKQIIEYIKNNYDKKINTSKLVEVTFRSKTYINNKFREDTGDTINNFINYYRIKESIKLIKKTDLTIEAIAEKVGFSNYRYFITVFKKYTHLTPKEFSDEYFNK